MTDEYVEETETLDDSQEDIEETSSDNNEEDTSKNEDEEDKDWKAEAEKWKDTASNYKREIETKGLRNKGNKDNTAVKTDFESKKADILDEFDSDLKELGEDDFEKVKTLIAPALDGIYTKASKENRFVARGELKRTVKDLIDFASSRKSQEEIAEKARLEGASEKDKIIDGEIKGKSKSKPSEGYSEEVKKLSKQKGWSLEETKIILDNQKRLDREYKPKY